MKPFVAPLACLALFAGPAAAQNLIPCAVKVAAPARIVATDENPDAGLVRTPANDVHCILGVPLALDGGVKLWRCLTEYPDDHEYEESDWSYAFLLERPGQPIQALQDEVMAGELDAYQVLSVDLDADGTEERVLAAWNAQGNGLGVNAWTLYVFSADWNLIQEYDQVLDWSRSGIVRAKAPRAGCDIALTTYEDFGPSAPGSVAFAARFVKLEGGKMAPAADREPLRRRLLNSFDRLRVRTFDKNPDDYEGDVAGWLNGR